jgi:hypothetical protein
MFIDKLLQFSLFSLRHCDFGWTQTRHRAYSSSGFLGIGAYYTSAWQTLQIGGFIYAAMH